MCPRQKMLVLFNTGWERPDTATLRLPMQARGQVLFYDDSRARRAASGSLLMICSKAAAGPLIRRCPCSHFR